MNVGNWGWGRSGLALACAVALAGSCAKDALAQGGRRGGPQPQALGAGSPPAAVPDILALPRPSAAEIEQAKQLVAKLKSDPASKALFDKWPDLVGVQPPPVNSAIVPSLAGGFVTKHNQNKEIAKAGNIDVLFMGDSITDFWRSETGAYAGKPVFDKYFGGVKVANFGISGDTTQGVLYRLKNGEGQGYQPKAVMLMIGTNNKGRNTPAEIAEGIGAIVLELRNDFPNAKILLLGIFPHGASPTAPQRAQIKEINEKIAKLNDDKFVFYRDIGEKFLDAQGNIPQDVMSDALHPSAKGYEIWAEAVKDELAKLAGVDSLAAKP